MEFSYDDFRHRALNTGLSKWEKIGFPDGYRKDHELAIFDDIRSKLDLSNAKSVLDIGCGCSDLVDMFIQFSVDNDQTLYLVDSAEMLSNIAFDRQTENVKCIPGRFPDESALKSLVGTRFDAIVVYSVLQYVFLDQSLYQFIHECLRLLNPGGRILLGDIPNFQARERFLQSEEGRRFLANAPHVDNSINLRHEMEERIDDSVVMSILMRFRQFGCETYLLPQPKGLPFANRREDIILVKR